MSIVALNCTRIFFRAPLFNHQLVSLGADDHSWGHVLHALNLTESFDVRTAPDILQEMLIEEVDLQ